MILTWYGLACIKLETQGKVIALNPFKKDSAKGLDKAPRFKTDIALISSSLPEYMNPEMVEAAEFAIDSPGEYEIGGVFIQGISNQKNSLSTQANPSARLVSDESERAPLGAASEEANTIFILKTEELSVAHLGAFNDAKLSEEAAEILEGVDVLILPVGGGQVLSGAKASSLITQIGPSLVIPVFYNIPGLKMKLDEVDKFINEVKLKPIREEKLNLKKKDLDEEETKLVLLSPQI